MLRTISRDGGSGEYRAANVAMVVAAEIAAEIDDAFEALDDPD